MKKEITKVVFEITADSFTKTIFSDDEVLLVDKMNMTSAGSAKGEQQYDALEDFYLQHSKVGETIFNLSGFDVAMALYATKYE